MISAADALKLPTAKLTNTQLTSVNTIMEKLDAHIRSSMEWRGVDFSYEETDPSVLAEVNQRLKAAGYSPEWRYRMEKHRLNAALTKLVGFDLTLGPSDEAYRSLR